MPVHLSCMHYASCYRRQSSARASSQCPSHVDRRCRIPASSRQNSLRQRHAKKKPKPAKQQQRPRPRPSIQEVPGRDGYTCMNRFCIYIYIYVFLSSCSVHISSLYRRWQTLEVAHIVLQTHVQEVALECPRAPCSWATKRLIASASIWDPIGGHRSEKRRFRLQKLQSQAPAHGYRIPACFNMHAMSIQKLMHADLYALIPFTCMRSRVQNHVKFAASSSTSSSLYFTMVSFSS